MIVYPPLTADEFASFCNGKRYIFTEDENGDKLYTFGHDRDAEFARQANEFDIEVGGIDPMDATYTIEDVHHHWAVTLEPSPEWRFTWRDVNELTLGAFPISVLWR